MACGLRFIYTIESLDTGTKSFTTNANCAEVFARKDRYKVTCKNFVRFYKRREKRYE